MGKGLYGIFLQSLKIICININMSMCCIAQWIFAESIKWWDPSGGETGLKLWILNNHNYITPSKYIYKKNNDRRKERKI